jgi:hypothetical protein
MQIERAMRLAAVQVNRYSSNGNMRYDQGISDKLPH